MSFKKSLQKAIQQKAKIIDWRKKKAEEKHERETQSNKKYKYHKKNYPAIPNQTLIDMMGEFRWGQIVKAVEKIHKTSLIIVQHTKPATLRAGGSEGAFLGTVRKTESWARKVLKK